MPNRSIATIQSELAEVRRHLVDVPPHSGQGLRDELADRINRLERELAAARTAAARE